MLTWTGMAVMGVAMGADVDLLQRDLAWRSVDDVVMGGVSAGRAVQHAEGLLFEGHVSLENNGGFSSIRSGARDLGLAGATAFRLVVRGDGKVYDFTVRRRDLPIRGGSWRAPVRTTGEWQEVTLPLADFQAIAFGRPIPDAPSLAGAGGQIESIGWLIAAKQAGPFKLEVRSIEVLGASTDAGGGPSAEPG